MPSTVSLIHSPHYQRICADTWLATACLCCDDTTNDSTAQNASQITVRNATQSAAQTSSNPIQTHKDTSRQSQGVRQLLSCLLTHLGRRDELDERQFPFRLLASGEYVSFSHSQNQLAVVVSVHQVAVDVEMRAVSWQLACRHFHANEVAMLNKYQVVHRQRLLKLLWQLKECQIKLSGGQLFSGLKTDNSQPLACFIQSLGLSIPPFVSHCQFTKQPITSEPQPHHCIVATGQHIWWHASADWVLMVDPMC